MEITLAKIKKFLANEDLPEPLIAKWRSVTDRSSDPSNNRVVVPLIRFKDDFIAAEFTSRSLDFDTQNFKFSCWNKHNVVHAANEWVVRIYICTKHYEWVGTPNIQRAYNIATACDGTLEDLRNAALDYMKHCAEQDNARHIYEIRAAAVQSRDEEIEEMFKKHYLKPEILFKKGNFSEKYPFKHRIILKKYTTHQFLVEQKQDLTSFKLYFFDETLPVSKTISLNKYYVPSGLIGEYSTFEKVLEVIDVYLTYIEHRINSTNDLQVWVKSHEDKAVKKESK